MSTTPSALEALPNPDQKKTWLVRLTCPEFTCLCPRSGQPDFAHMIIDYVPRGHIVESKSFKLFMHGFRNRGIFHEACTLEIADVLCQVLKPIWLRIGGYWYPRGGIPIDVFFQTGTPPQGLWIPDPKVAAYRGRG